jgi:L-asparaginase
MRSPSSAGADGPANLLAAVTIAASPVARGLGVVVVLGDEVHAARSVRKAHATSISAFRSPDFGPLGHVSEGRIVLGRRGTPVHLPDPLVAAALAELERPRVAVLPMTLGQDPALLAALAPGLDGLVIAGFGVGHVPMSAVQTLDDLADRIPVVLATRTGAGSTARQTYSYPGSEADLVDRGLIPAGYLDPYKSRILLHLLLAARADGTTVRRTFRELGEYA